MRATSRTSHVGSTALALTVAVVSVLMGAQQNVPRVQCQDCGEARYWRVDPQDWRQAGPPAFPEQAKLASERPYDVGVAFSGGGTRSASATIGQLRGLQRNGWLARVRYVTAVSGGSWAAVPYTYYSGPLDDLLGPYVPSGRLNPAEMTRTPAGRLAGRVVESELGHVGLQEVPQLLPDQIGGRDLRPLRDVVLRVQRGFRKWRGRDLPEPDRRNKTYARMLGQIFLGASRRDPRPLVPDGNLRPYTWDRGTAIEVAATAGRFSGDLVQVPGDRPFLVVGGSMVWAHPALAYPRLIPVEYTPLYTGVRQRFGNIGGTYVSPWAYDRLQVAPGSDGRVLVEPAPEGRPFTLADVIASSGAAPQLALLLGDGVPARLQSALREAADAFPAFTNLSIRDDRPEPPSAELPHGDGGFTDNLGVMPLLARQVRHIIVFVNSNRPWAQNDQLQSYFIPFNVRDGGGDKSMNGVFEPSRYRELLDGLDAAAASGGPALYCGKGGWPVRPNEIYNIRAYDGLRICWVYNHAATSWKRLLPPIVQVWLDWTEQSGTPRTDESRALESFPYYATFGENRLRVIQLNPLQVNLLADLAAWSITTPAAVNAVVGAFGDDVLPRPREE